MSRRHRTMAEDHAGGRELAALVDGPFRLRWYWRDELEAMQEASRRTGHADDHPAARMRSYRPTDQRQPHPLETGITGRVWTFQPPQEPAPASSPPSQPAEARKP